MRVFYDVDTQNDFMNKNGALYVPGAEKIKPNLALLTQYAKLKNFPIPTLGSVDKHFGTKDYKKREGELKRWGGPFPDHCMNECYGQRKINETSHFESWSNKKEVAVYIPHNIKGGLSERSLRSYANIISKEPFFKGAYFEREAIYFEKQSHDVFTNPAAEEILKRANVKEAVVYGVATDYCVKAAVLGMQKRGIQTYVVKDAIKGVSEKTAKSALEEMLKAGARFVSTEDILGGSIKCKC